MTEDQRRSALYEEGLIQLDSAAGEAALPNNRHNNRRDEQQRGLYRSRDWLDKTIGTVASVLGMLVILASVPTASRTWVVATTGVLFGAFGYRLGARWVGAVTILISVVAGILTRILT
jgi:hypothetical protein